MRFQEFEASLIGRPNTLKTQISLFRNWVKPNIEMPIDPRLLDKIFHICQEGSLKSGTTKAVLGVAIKYIEFITGNKPASRNLMKIVQRLEMPAEVKVWTKEEAQKALEACKDALPWLYLPLLLTMHLGLRKGEAIGLKWEDVDIINGNIKVRRSYDGPTKSGRPRVVPLSDKLALELEKWFIVGEEETQVFDYCDLNYHLKKLCKIAGVKEITWHSLRHFFATQALEARVSPKLVQTMLGHQRISTVLDIYWATMPEDINLDFLP